MIKILIFSLYYMQETKELYPNIPFNPDRDNKERKEKMELPKFTLYIMRHGQSNENKSDPNRGLTETGQTQVRESFTRLLDEVLAEEMPEFNDWDNAEAKKAAIARIAPKLEFHLRDSGTYRTIQQEWLEAKILNEMGITDFYLPKAAYDWKGEKPPEKAGPGIAKRLKGVQGLDKSPNFRKLIGDKEYQKKVGAIDEITAWALTPDEEIPSGVESRQQMVERYGGDLAKLQKITQSRRISQYPKRIIVVANSHASIITLSASEELNIPLTELGEIENAEGLRLNFYSGSKPYEVKPFGEKTETKAAQFAKK